MVLGRGRRTPHHVHDIFKTFSHRIILMDQGRDKSKEFGKQPLKLYCMTAINVVGEDKTKMGTKNDLDGSPLHF